MKKSASSDPEQHVNRATTAGAYEDRGLEAIWDTDWCQDHHIHTLIHAKYSLHPLLLQLESKDASAGGGRGENRLSRKETSSKPPLWAYATATWDPHLPPIQQCWSLNRGEAQAKNASGFSPSISSSSSYQGDGCQHNMGEDMTCAHIWSSSSTKATEHRQTV